MEQEASTHTPAAPDLELACRRLESNVEVFRGLLRGVSAGQALWRPAKAAWSMVEVVAHLHDEEREDFRPRLRRTLEEPGRAWDPIDPSRWAVERGYRERDMQATLEAFAKERGRSVDWLRSLQDPDWSQSCPNPRLGPLRAGDLLGSWLAHDLLHVRQITRLHHEHLTREGGWGTEYAGAW